ncbi:unnamed protein product [Ranitomeya imitator]|uniref:Uncharacterized protein n=1 Tax=Ranitomeya imitator TaxID=111125 RepID=A0ABN9MDL0_9NEOB|nr:unnamed protein product [Ranitomeya imitator]
MTQPSHDSCDLWQYVAMRRPQFSASDLSAAQPGWEWSLSERRGSTNVSWHRQTITAKSEQYGASSLQSFALCLKSSIPPHMGYLRTQKKLENNFWGPISSVNLDMEHNNPAYTISAALCYATQLVNTLSHMLSVNLPRKLYNSEFCGENLSRWKFNRAVNKLNSNILYLCFSQHVDLDLLHPLHTLRNLMYLVSPDSENLGRSGPFEVTADLEDSMEFVDPSGAGDSDESGDEHVSDEETDLGTDWENLPSPKFFVTSPLNQWRCRRARAR